MFITVLIVTILGFIANHYINAHNWSQAIACGVVTIVIALLEIARQLQEIREKLEK